MERMVWERMQITMTTLRDLLRDLIEEAFMKGKEVGLGNEMEDEEMLKEDLLDEYTQSIIDRFVG